jgi:hypothetical protein
MILNDHMAASHLDEDGGISSDVSPSDGRLLFPAYSCCAVVRVLHSCNNQTLAVFSGVSRTNVAACLKLSGKCFSERVSQPRHPRVRRRYFLDSRGWRRLSQGHSECEDLSLGRRCLPRRQSSRVHFRVHAQLLSRCAVTPGIGSVCTAMWKFGEDGLMRLRLASINDLTAHRRIRAQISWATRAPPG